MYPINVAIVLSGLTLVATFVAVLARRERTLQVLGAAIIFGSLPGFLTILLYVSVTSVILLIAAGIAVKDRESSGTAIADLTAIITILAFFAGLPIYVLSF